MLLEDYCYIDQIEYTKDTVKDAERLMCANGKENTYEHMLAVANESVLLAGRFNLDQEKCFKAAVLHDISAIIKPSDMLTYARNHDLLLCEAEIRYPFLLHQRLSKIIAEECFSVSDHEILSAIECHTTLKKNADAYDMVLFIADKLAWDQEGIPPFYQAVKEALAVSLEKACHVYMCYMEESGRLLCPHTNWTEARQWLKSKI